MDLIITPSRSPQSHLLLDLVHLLFQEFKCVASAHECLLGHLKSKRKLYQTKQQNQSEITLYEMADIWSKVQAVVSITYLIIFNIH